ncbi:MAG TPA: hypothetical protein VHP12_02060, partial [Chitinophagaceae bacterium]|nr:hypothetical protein [Chitinophagaceae bacterium]
VSHGLSGLMICPGSDHYIKKLKADIKKISALCLWHQLLCYLKIYISQIILFLKYKCATPPQTGKALQLATKYI